MKDQLHAICRQAGNLMLQREQFAIEEKDGHANFVTSVDKAVQDYLAESLEKLMPGARLIGEEKDNAPLQDGPTWVVDPIDGTTNFIHDYRASAVSIALLQGGRPVIGAVYQPYTQEFFFAEKGRGAYLNDAPMHVTRNDLRHALVGFGTAPYNAELAQKSMAIALDFLRAASDIRRCGSAALDLAYVACGRQDVFFELRLNPWDFAAGALLVTEAGGRFAMPLSAEVDFGAPNAVLVSNAVCAHDAERIFLSHCGG